MNDTQELLYNYLLTQNKLNPDRWITQEEICEALPEHFKLNHLAVKKMCCSYIHGHVMAINQDENIEQIVLYRNQTYKLAKDFNEAKDFLKNKLLIKGCKMLKRYWSLLDKANKDGQANLDGEEFKTFINERIFIQ